MTDYYCSESAKNEMERLTPEDIDTIIEEFDAPDGHAVISSYNTVYFMSLDDFQPDSRVVLYDPVFEIEYFENGVPEWLKPKHGIAYYYCTWTRNRWNFEEDYTK